MTRNLDNSSKPVICAAISFKGSPREFTALTIEDAYHFEGSGAAALHAVHTQLDGSLTLGQLARRHDLDVDELVAALEILREDKYLIDATAPLRAPTQQSFIDAVFEEARFWNANMYAQPLFKPLFNGEASRSLVLGWGLEYYHFVESANEHMAMGVGYCRKNHRLRELMIEHYIEEWNHSEIFLTGLVKSGLDRDMVMSSIPLVATRALIDYLNELAYEHPLAYSACYGIMQSGNEATTALEVNEFYDRLKEHYPYAEGMLDGVRKHALIDVGLDHHKTPLEHYAAFAEITQEERLMILESLRGTSEHFIQWFEGIYDHYAALDGFLLRRPVDVRVLV